jgi:hypothetical protein
MKKSNLKTLWMYLARRDKKGVKIISKFYSRDIDPIVIDDLKIFNLPSSWYGKIKSYIDDNLIYWEPWIQTAVNFDELKTNLKKRGYSELPANGSPMILVTPTLFVNSNFFAKQPTMIQKN